MSNEDEMGRSESGSRIYRHKAREREWTPPQHATEHLEEVEDHLEKYIGKVDDVIVASSAIHGLGVFATRDFCHGETVLLIDDSRMVDEEHPLRPECGEYEYHCDYLAGGKIVLLRPPERHINSSCDPNTCVRWEGGKRYVIARRAIGNGEEITYDYIIDCHGGKEWECRCGSARCRGIIVSSFFELPIGIQREYLPLLSEWFIEEHRESVEL